MGEAGLSGKDLDVVGRAERLASACRFYHLCPKKRRLRHLLLSVDILCIRLDTAITQLLAVHLTELEERLSLAKELATLWQLSSVGRSM